MPIHGADASHAAAPDGLNGQILPLRRARDGGPAGVIDRWRGATLGEYLDDFGANPLQVHAKALEDSGGDSIALPDEPEQEMLGADVMVTETACFVHRQLDDLLGAWGEADLSDHLPLAAADDEFDGAPHLGKLDAEVGEHLGGDAFSFPHQAEQKCSVPM